MEVERSVLGRSWRLRDCDEAQALAISQQQGVPELVGRVLAGRGVRPASRSANARMACCAVGSPVAQAMRSS